MLKHDRVTGLILAGGKATRLDQQDKGLIPLNGQPMVAHVIARLAPQVDDLILNANRNFEEYTSFGFPVLRDDLPDFQGPLAGILTGMHHSTSEWLVISPCDTPFLPQDMVRRLLEAATQTNALAAIPFDGERRHYLHALLHRSLQYQLETWLVGKQRSMRGWLQQIAPTEVDFSDQATSFLNVNTHEELLDAQRAVHPAPKGQRPR